MENLRHALINCEVSLTLVWTENCVLTDLITQAAVAAQGNNPARPAINAPKNATFKITDTTLYVSVVTLSTKDDNKLLEQLQRGLERTMRTKRTKTLKRTNRISIG